MEVRTTGNPARDRKLAARREGLAGIGKSENLDPGSKWARKSLFDRPDDLLPVIQEESFANGGGSPVAGVGLP